VVNAGFLLNMEAVVESYNYPKCEKCGEDKNMYGGCRCNGYTTAFNAVENQHIPQQPQERHYDDFDGCDDYDMEGDLS